MGILEIVGRQGRKAYFDGVSFVSIECSNCIKIKEISDFRSKKGQFGGVISQCKECEANYKSKWHQENKERNNKRQSLYRKENPEKCKRASRELNAVKAEKLRAYSRERYRNNAERIKNYNREYYDLNKLQGRALKNISCQRRRARKRLLPDNLSVNQVVSINKHFNGKCALSEETLDLHLDHVIPISIGHGGTILGNIIPLSATLNLSKRNFHIFEWFSLNQEQLQIPQNRFDFLIEYLARTNEMTPSEYRNYVDWCFDNPTN